MSDISATVHGNTSAKQGYISDKVRQRSAEIAQKFPDYSGNRAPFAKVLRNAQVSEVPVIIPSSNGKHPEYGSPSETVPGGRKISMKEAREMADQLLRTAEEGRRQVAARDSQYIP